MQIENPLCKKQQQVFHKKEKWNAGFSGIPLLIDFSKILKNNIFTQVNFLMRLLFYPFQTEHIYS